MARASPLRYVTQGYLFCFNLMMFLVHYFVLVDVLFDVKKGVYNYSHHFRSLKFVTALQVLDLIHAFIGLTKTNAFMGCVQVFGRLLVLFSIRGVESLYKNWLVMLLVVVYLSIEVFRYPYYMLRSINMKWYPISWLRYHSWIILYPMGFVLEFYSLFHVLNYHNKKNVVGHMVPEHAKIISFVQIFLSLLFGAFFPFLALTLLHHMDRQRQSHFGGPLMFITPRRLNTRIRSAFRSITSMLSR